VSQAVSPFPDRLAGAVRRKKNPVVVGLDPRREQLPGTLLSGESLAELAQAYETFCKGVIDVVAPLVPAVKPQAAFFEELGPAGMAALGSVIRHAAGSGLLVILDGKRNDIGSTAEGYARAYLGPGGRSAWGADALTVSPYLGADSLEPFAKAAAEQAAGIFVLVKTSNPGGGMLQDLVADGEPVYRHVARHVESLAAASAGQSGYGNEGAVVGATYPEQLAELRAAMPHAWFLVPGFGAQGGAAADIAGGFADDGLGAVINSSRAIIFAHRRSEYAERFGDSRWQEAVEEATRQTIAQIRDGTPAGRL